ncbi:MAG: hypothetical protein H0U45_11560 [Tatlockia sp.]|nr:hypothetical protein [Tatlockia sp.]
MKNEHIKRVSRLFKHLLLERQSPKYLDWLETVSIAHKHFKEIKDENLIEVDTGFLDKAMLLEEYKLHIDLYKHYLTVVATFNGFYYAVTGGFLTYYFNQINVMPYLNWSLIFFIIMSLSFAIIYNESWRSFEKSVEQVERIALTLGFAGTEVRALSMALGASSLLFFIVTLGFFLIFILKLFEMVKFKWIENSLSSLYF